ncbi:aldo/keto reductase [Caulobacter sp. KR2-114]|uniref:aldo/keto reductase n=1 Tax=Caulobacter sp. KR2-114 TaxID=3400912 RepID=UPI003C0560A0
MRYRPLGKTGMAVSTLSLRLNGERCGGDPDAWLAFIHAAFENGVNAFEVVHPTSALLEGLAYAARSVERRLIFVALRLSDGLGPDEIVAQVDHVLLATGLEALDLVIVDGDGELHNESVWALEDLRSASRVLRLGVVVAGDEGMQHVHGGAFDVLLAPFNLLSGWRERLRVRTATDKGMSVVALDPYPEEARAIAEPKAVKRRWFSRPTYPLAGLGSYNFLHDTHGWKAEEICLGFALTETAVASVVVEVDSHKHLEALAEVTERDLPAAVAAQIEMARFSAERAAGTERRTLDRRARAS